MLSFELSKKTYKVLLIEEWYIDIIFVQPTTILLLMNNGKAIRPTNIHIKVIKKFRDKDIGWLIKNFNEIMRKNQMSDKRIWLK